MKTSIYIFAIVSFLFSCTTAQTETQNLDTMTKPTVIKSDEEWKKELSPAQYHVLRESGTERPGTGEYNLHFEDGVYHCAGCNSPLFKSDNKFESHCGWPSFDAALSDSTVNEVMDYSHGMTRIEIRCAKCDGHLGHVFNDGPTKTGMRYCINSAALGFEKDNTQLDK